MSEFQRSALVFFDFSTPPWQLAPQRRQRWSHGILLRVDQGGEWARSRSDVVIDSLKGKCRHRIPKGFSPEYFFLVGFWGHLFVDFQDAGRFNH